MSKFLPFWWVLLSASLTPATLHAAGYVWDNQDQNGVWNDPVNWGMTNNAGYNVEPTALDGAIFLKNVSPGGTVTFTADAFAQYVRQDSSRAHRTLIIHPDEVVNRTLTLSGTAPALIDGWNAWVDFALDGAANANSASLKLKLDGSGSGLGTRVNKAVTLRISCDVRGTGGFILNGGEDGAGRLLLSGANTYTGPTTANAGVLILNGSTAAGSAVTVNPGGTLGGVGTIGGPVTVAAGGLLSPGVNSQAPLIGSLTLNSNLTLAGDVLIEVNKVVSPSNDTVIVSGTLTNSGLGSVQVLTYGQPLAAGDSLKVFNKPMLNGGALRVLSSGHEVWTNKLAVDGSIAVLYATNAPISGDPTNVFTWKGTVTTDEPWKVPMGVAVNWNENEAPAPRSSNIFVFEGDVLVPYQWPYVDTNYGTSILLFSNNIALNSIKILGGNNNTMKLGSYVRQDTAQPCYFGITGPVPIKGVDGVMHTVTCGFFTNLLGDASCGSQTDFQCTGGRLDVYAVLKDGEGTSSRLIKSGNYTLNLTGDLVLGNDANIYTGGTIVNAGVVKMQKLPGFAAIPGDVTVNGTGGLVINIGGGEQIGDLAIVTLNDGGYLSLAGQPETVKTVQGASSRASVSIGTGGTLKVSPSATSVYNGGLGVSEFAGSISAGALEMNGTGVYGMLGANSVAAISVNSGMLKVNGNSGTGTIAVGPGATLLAQSGIAGPVTVNDGGTIGAGFGAGTLTLSAGLTLGDNSVSGATNVWELAALKDTSTGIAGTDFDQIVLSGGSLILNSNTTLDIRFTGSATEPNANEPFWQAPRTWKIVSVAGGSNPGNATFVRVRNANYPAGRFATSVDGAGSIVLTFTPAPRLASIDGPGTTNVSVSWSNAAPGLNYVLQYNTNLNTTSWIDLAPVTALSPTATQTDYPPMGERQRFYRVRIQ